MKHHINSISLSRVQKSGHTHPEERSIYLESFMCPRLIKKGMPGEEKKKKAVVTAVL